MSVALPNGLKLGKKAARHSIVYNFNDFFDAKKLPQAPAVFGHYGAVDHFFMLGNANYSDCVFAGAAHETMIWNVGAGRHRTPFLTKDVLADYSAVTGFNPKDPRTDQGTDMAAAAKYRQDVGVRDAQGVRHKIDCYLALKIGNLEQLVAAMYLFGAVGIGVQLPSGADSQFDNKQPWDVPAKPDIVGGHYVVGVGRNAADNLVVITWGRTQEMTPQFYERFSDEAVAYLSLDALDAKNLSPEGYDAVTLRQTMKRFG